MQPKMINQVEFEGYVGRQPKNVSKEGKGPFITMGIRQDIFYEYTPPNGVRETRKKEYWVSAVCFGNIAAKMLIDVRPGDRIVVRGSLRPNNYKKDGNTIFSMEIQIHSYHLVAKSGLAEQDEDQAVKFDKNVDPEAFQDDIPY